MGAIKTVNLNANSNILSCKLTQDSLRKSSFINPQQIKDILKLKSVKEDQALTEAQVQKILFVNEKKDAVLD